MHCWCIHISYTFFKNVDQVHLHQLHFTNWVRSKKGHPSLGSSENQAWNKKLGKVVYWGNHCRKHSAERDTRKANKVFINWGLLLQVIGAHSHRGHSKVPQRRCLRIDSPKEKESEISIFRLPSLIDWGWSQALHLWILLHCPADRLSKLPCLWRGPYSTE